MLHVLRLFLNRFEPPAKIPCCGGQDGRKVHPEEPSVPSLGAALGIDVLEHTHADEVAGPHRQYKGVPQVVGEEYITEVLRDLPMEFCYVAPGGKQEPFDVSSNRPRLDVPI